MSKRSAATGSCMAAFTDNGLENMVAFSETLRGIHARLVTEGYVIEDGRFIAPERPGGDKPSNRRD